MGSMVSWDPASLTGQGMKNSAEQQMKSAEEPAFPSPKHPPTVSPPPPPGTDRMHLSLLPDPGRGRRRSGASHRILEFLIVFSVIGPCPPFFFCKRMMPQSGAD